ncbi:TetR/AcrR family transcriptional regulator [Natrinema sp. LN54]|uniref:TetR/AcrR family transcriptional regulator n=1 Tax=Natrinema sp. LN54 TaxID=3458705 RepID=UPI00403552C0
MATVTNELFDDPSGTREKIMIATLRSLREHGYADLTIEKIGDEFEKSQSLIYHHYDGKDDLVLETLEFVLDRHSEQVIEERIEDPRSHLEKVIEQFVGSSNEEQSQLSTTLFELRARAIHDEAYRKHFTRSDEIFEQYLADIIASGIECNVFRECEAQAVATTIVTMINGILVRRSTNHDEGWLEDVRGELDTYLEMQVYQTDGE